MLNPKLMGAWFTVMAEAAKGTEEAQEAFKLFTEASTDPEAMKRWQARFMPLGGAAAQPEAFEEWLEDWWRMMGVVPRTRYLELLEQNDQLRRRLEKAEETIRSLRAMLGQGQEQDAQKMVNLWETMLQDSLKAQADWMRSWVAATEKKEETTNTE